MAEINNEVLNQIITLLSSLKEPEAPVDYSKMSEDELRYLCANSECETCEICKTYECECDGCPKSMGHTHFQGDDSPRPDPGNEECEKDDDNAIHVLSPKGIALFNLANAQILYSYKDPRFDIFWDNFTKDMERFGYIKDE